MRCVVTGASGHIGSHLVRRLLADGHTVAIVLRETSSRAAIEDLLPRVEIILGELESSTYAAPLIAFAPDAVFHLAWSGITAADRNTPAQITSNVRGTLALLEAAHTAGAQLFLSTGSQAEYGRVSGAITETCPLQPETAYGIAKAALSQLIPAFCERAGMRALWLRIFSVYGPGDATVHMLPSLIEQLLRRERPSLTAGEQQWDYLYVDDAVAAIAQAAAAPGLQGTFNVASGRAVSLRAIIETARDLIDPALPLGLGDLPYRPDQVMHLEGDITRLREATGWQPQVSLEDGLRRTIAWHQGRTR